MSCVLIVEDEKRLRDIVRDYFTGHGLDCDLARDGAEALDLLRDHDYDAILLDILMPGLDGFAVREAVRRSFSRRSARSGTCCAATRSAATTM